MYSSFLARTKMSGTNSKRKVTAVGNVRIVRGHQHMYSLAAMETLLL
ncbi:unnamed protein product [Strongylus vulgaris]|uniref:Uncharacterized protein n=1 Tax=Strongylus vulgaris TaxID=40348 RepID=A0A3P7JG09_STRVU|nr:unnamed protein product [Strongylus vulgaris]